MSTPKKSKAQMVRELKKAMDLVRARDEQIADMKWHVEKVVELRAHRDQLEERIKTGHSEYATMKDDRDAKAREVYDMRKTLAARDEEIKDLRQELEDWKQAYTEMDVRMKRMRKNFYQQAALAGELADNAYATVAPTKNAEEAR